MKKIALIVCIVSLASTALAAPKAKKVSTVKKTSAVMADAPLPPDNPPRDEVKLRMKNATPTKIIVSGGAVISAPPQLLRVSAQSFAYKVGGTDASPFGRTILKGDKKGNASVTLIASKGKAPIKISAPEIEVETVLTEIEINSPIYYKEYTGEIPYGDLADALKTALHSPRFWTSYSDSALSTFYTVLAIYDRRTKNLFTSYAHTGMDGKFQEHRHTETNITDPDIEKRGANATRIKRTPE